MLNIRPHKYVFLFLIVLLLSGCHRSEKSASNIDAEVWTSWPQLNYGIMEYQKLTVQPWHSGRCAATTQNRMAETEDGYFLAQNNFLYYADKTDLSKWVLACNRPDCTHSYASLARCGAYCMTGQFTVKADRVFFCDTIDSYPHLYNENAYGFAVFSRSLDGSDVRLEYADKQLLSEVAIAYGVFTAPDYLVFNMTILNPDGSNTLRCHRVSETGTELLTENTTTDTDIVAKRMLRSSIFGEPSFNHVYLGDPPYSECRYADGELYYTDLTGYYDEGIYLSGDYLRSYKVDHGYYDVDLTSKEETLTAAVRMEKGQAFAFLPNCIVESSLFYQSHQQASDGSTHKMEFFDGESWRTVLLPEELVQAEAQKYLIPLGVSSDSIFFTRQRFNDVYLYRIPIAENELRMEYCGQIK